MKIIVAYVTCQSWYTHPFDMALNLNLKGKRIFFYCYYQH